MAVLRFKPDRISYAVVSGGYEDSDGNFHEGKPVFEGSIRCDAVVSGKAERRTFEDGVVRAYSYEVTLPADCRDFRIGERVRVAFLGGTEREFDVKGFDRKQHQCKLWL